MTAESLSARLARGWIEAWIRMDMAWLRKNLADDFVHTSPFGRLEGREDYLAAVEPMARKSVTRLVIRQVISQEDRAAIWFENHTPGGVVQSCDWVMVHEEKISEIFSFYDSVKVRQALSPEDQEQLDGSY